MLVVELQNNSLKEAIPESGFAIVDYYASWCGPCKIISKTLEKISASHNVKIIKVNTEEFPELSESISSLPTLVFYKDGAEINTVVGAIPEPKIVALLK